MRYLARRLVVPAAALAAALLPATQRAERRPTHRGSGWSARRHAGARLRYLWPRPATWRPRTATASTCGATRTARRRRLPDPRPGALRQPGRDGHGDPAQHALRALVDRLPRPDGRCASGGRPAGLLTPEAGRGRHRHLHLRGGKPGTYLYESGSDPAKQIEMGLYGALIVRPAPPPPGLRESATAFDPSRVPAPAGRGGSRPAPRGRDRTRLRLQAAQPLLHHQRPLVPGHDPGQRLRDPAGSALRGARPHPAEPPGERVAALIRMINAGLLNHPFHPHGNHTRQIAQDGRRSSPRRRSRHHRALRRDDRRRGDRGLSAALGRDRHPV